MFRFYEALFLKPYYVQCIAIFVFTLGISLLAYFSCIEQEKSEIEFQISENKKLKHQLKEEKSRYEQWLKTKMPPLSPLKTDAYLNSIYKYSSASFWFPQLIEEFKTRCFFFKKIEVKEAQENSHQSISVHFSLAGSYWNLVEVFKELQKFHFISVEGLSIQKSQNEGEGGKIDAKMVLKIYLLQ